MLYSRLSRTSKKKTFHFVIFEFNITKCVIHYANLPMSKITELNIFHLRTFHFYIIGVHMYIVLYIYNEQMYQLEKIMYEMASSFDF